MKVLLRTEEIRKYLEIDAPDFPRYSGYLINLANRWAQGTRPKVVGQMSDLIQEFSGRSLDEWERWYLAQKPNAIRDASNRIMAMLQNMKEAIERIDQDTIEQWVRDLVVVKTFVGLRCQEAILKKGAEIMGVGYRLSESEEESRGIDGYIGNIPVSIKPHTYQLQTGLLEDLGARIVYYRKVDGGVEVDFGQIISSEG